MKLRTRPLLAALAVAGVTAAGLVGTTATAPAAEAAAPTTIRVIQHNTDQHKDRFQQVVRDLEQGRADVATMQEVCQSWVKDLKKKHKGWTVSYHEQTSNDRCPAGKGNVAIRPGKGSIFAEAYKVPGEGKTFGLACVVFGFGGHRTHACSTHLSTYDTNAAVVRRGETERIKAITNAWIDAQDAVIVAGDLNSQPTSTELDPLYMYPQARSEGRFVEAGQLPKGRMKRVGPDTHRKGKIDYVFFSENHTPLGAGGKLVQDPTTGHKILRVTTTLR
ncbi:endonuclease/exonuclease/phosphatase family protein [Phycicoccus sonneratiae]|uniref:Endonuclease/exonuclease/phosphatase family protein n=1 Tax=Phycicoccus sonneratiae TaxID=2807628 RepID=A0ABS2CJX7_9MICO|nr:endonuclease/exonuclease/phosphatase family protein [Phycicoccus sonneraticus]MBM6400148.1 endonuclease/exonuclease/phosphatase family protein [Phycicoccus sonneraticus]